MMKSPFNKMVQTPNLTFSQNLLGL